jgi:hypothetical protein
MRMQASLEVVIGQFDFSLNAQEGRGRKEQWLEAWTLSQT